MPVLPISIIWFPYLLNIQLNPLSLQVLYNFPFDKIQVTEIHVKYMSAVLADIAYFLVSVGSQHGKAVNPFHPKCLIILFIGSLSPILYHCYSTFSRESLLIWSSIKDEAVPYLRMTSSFLYFVKGWFNVRSSISWDLFIKLKFYQNIMFWDNHMPQKSWIMCIM